MLRRDRFQTLLLSTLITLPILSGLYAGYDSALEKADFTFVNQGEVSSLDPARATGIPEGRILMAIFEGLTGLNPETLAPVPACAESWEVLEEGKRVRFFLRDGLSWSNGDPLTARDFLLSWKRLLDPRLASPYAYLLWGVEGAREWNAGEGDPGLLGLSAPDPLTFEVRLHERCPYFVLLTAFYPLFPVHGKELQDDPPVSPDAIVSNGPFVVELRRLKDRIRLRRNPLYWDRGNVALETIDALAVTSPMTALNLYLTGEVDWINKVPPVVLPLVRDRSDFSLSPNLGTNFLRMNTTKPPLNDPRVREAIALALDRRALVDYILKGGEVPATSFVPPGLPGYHPPARALYDLERAAALLAEAGFPEGRGFPEINLLYSADETNRDIAEVLALDLRKNLGLKIHPMAQERKGYFVSQNALSYQLCLCSWLGDYLDPSTFLDVFRSDSGNNRTGWKNGGYNAWLDEAATLPASEERSRALSNAEALLLKELPLAPLYFRSTSNMIKPVWDGYFDNIQDVHPLKYLKAKTP